MSYELAIYPDAEREWGKLDETVKKRFRQKLRKERLIKPRVAKDALCGLLALSPIKPTTGSGFTIWKKSVVICGDDL